jgi:hypothetical protein
LTNSPELRIFPNPVTDWVTIERRDGEGEALAVRVVDLAGREVLSISEYLLAGDSMKIDMGKLPEGMYQVFLENASGDRVRVEKLLKK